MDLGWGEEQPLDTLALDVHDLAAVVRDVGLDSLYDELIEALRTGFATFDAAHVADKARMGFSSQRRVW